MRLVQDESLSANTSRVTRVGQDSLKKPVEHMCQVHEQPLPLCEEDHGPYCCGGGGRNPSSKADLA